MMDAPSMEDIKVLYKRGEDGSIVPKMVYDVPGYEAAINEGFTPQTPENFTFVKMFRQKEDGGYETKVARSPEEMNRMIARRIPRLVRRIQAGWKPASVRSSDRNARGSY